MGMNLTVQNTTAPNAILMFLLDDQIFYWKSGPSEVMPLALASNIHAYIHHSCY